jgi:transposase
VAVEDPAEEDLAALVANAAILGEGPPAPLLRPVPRFASGCGRSHRPWDWLRDLLVRHGIDLRLAHAKFLKAIAYAKVKTDAVDAGTLGQLLRTGFIPEAHMISDELRGPRDVLRTGLRLVQRCRSCWNTVDRLLEKFNVASVDQLPPLYRTQAGVHAAQIAVLSDQIRPLERLVRPALLDCPDIQQLLWLPGIGWCLTAFNHLPRS